MNRRQYYPARNAFSGFLPPSQLSAPSLPLYPPHYAIAPMSTPPMIAQHEYCPMCVRMPLMTPYQQQCSPYMYYANMPVPAPDLCRILPTGAGLVPAPGAMLYPQNVPLPSNGPLYRPTSGLSSDQAYQVRSNFPASSNPAPASAEVASREDQRQAARNRSKVRSRGNWTQNRTRASNASRNTFPHKLKQRAGASVRKSTNKSKRSSIRARSRVHSVEATELSSIARVEVHDTDYDSWEEVENEEEDAGDGSEWLNDTRLVVEAPALTNRHTKQTSSDKKTQEDSIEKCANLLPMDYTLITNDKSFSHVNYNPDLVPQKLDKMWIQIGTPKPRRKLPGPTTTVPSDSHYDSNPTICITNANGPKTSGLCEMSVRHLSNDEVYYVVRPKLLGQATEVGESSSSGKDGGNTLCPPRTEALQIFGETSKLWDASDTNNNSALADSSRARRLSAFINISASSSEDKVPTLPDANNNDTLERSKEFWWDRSTDVGYKDTCCDAQTKEGTVLKYDSVITRNQSGAYVREVDDFVVVDTAPQGPLRTGQDYNNNATSSEVEIRETSLTCEDANYTQDKRKLDVDWNSIRSLVPKEYSTRSYTQEGTAEFYDFDSTLGLVSCPGDNSVQAKGAKRWSESSNEHGPISEQDAAIVAFVEKHSHGACPADKTADVSLKQVQGNTSSTETKSQVTNTTRHVEAKRVTTPCSKSRPVNNWGKQDVRLLLIATSGTVSPSVTTTWCPPSASTPSGAITPSTRLSLLSQATEMTSNKRTAERANAKKQAKSLPASPEIRRGNPRKNTGLAASVDCIPTVVQQSQQWNTITQTPDQQLLIDCQKFSKVPTTQVEGRRQTDSPDFWRKPYQNKHKTYLLTPASSELVSASPVVPNNKRETRSQQFDKHFLGNDKLKTHSRRSAIPQIRKVSTTQNHPRRQFLAPPCSEFEVNTVEEMPRGNLQAKSGNLAPTSQPTSPTTSNTLTPASTPEYAGLGPTGSKTVVKCKRRSSLTNRRKPGAKKSIVMTSPTKVTTQQKAKPVTRKHTGKSANKPILSKRSVNSVPAVRRSPRTSRQAISLKSAANSNIGRSSDEVNKGTKKSGALQDALPRSELKKDLVAHQGTKKTVKSTSDKSSPELYALRSPPSGVTVQRTKQHANEPLKNVPSKTGDLARNVSEEMNPCDVDKVTHGHVHSSIQTIVHKLVHQTTTHHTKPTCSPSLAALREKGVYRYQAEIYQTVVGTSTSSVTKVRKRANSAPSSPTNVESPNLTSSKRSVSLSDVFYDSTVNVSLPVWDSKLNEDQDLSSSFVAVVREGHCADVGVAKRDADSHQAPNQAVVRRFREIHGSSSTYVGFSPPTMTPPAKFTSPNKRETPGVACGEPSDGLGGLVDSLIADEESPESHSPRILSDDMETEIRKKVEDLLASVREDSLKSISGMSSKEEGAGKQNTLTTTSRGRKKSLDQSTQTNVSDKDISVASTGRLSLPPKKPPRSNSPSNLSSVGANANEKGSAVAAAPSSVVGSPIIPYYPLLTTFSRFSPHRHPHFLSPTLVPINLSQQLYRAPGVAGLVWSSQTSKGAVTTNDEFAANQETKTSQPATKKQQANPLDLSGQSSMAEVAPSVVMLPASGVLPSYFIPPAYPEVPHPRGLAGKKVKPNLRRRRSFPGPISSSSVAKARLNRRYGLARNQAAQKFGKVATFQTLNLSHPVARLPLPHRRTRFAKSSLSDDVVFQSVEQRSRNPVFVTKPARDKVYPATHAETNKHPQPTTDTSSHETTETKQEKEKMSLVSEVVSGTETGYSSAASSSGRTTPETAEDRTEKTGKRLDVIHEGKQQNISLPETQHTETHHKEVLDDRHTKGKKLPHFHTIKKIKRFMSTKKSGKHDHTVANPEQIAMEHEARGILRKSETDTKLSKKTDFTHEEKGGAVRDILRKTKKSIADRSDHGTLQLAGNSEQAAKKKFATSDPKLIPKPGYRNYDFKTALLKPSFVAVAPSEVQPPSIAEEERPPHKHHQASLDTSIRATNTRRSVSTPGIRINSETGDVIDDEKLEHAVQHRPMHKILSSTAIEEDSLEEESKTLKVGDGAGMVNVVVHGKESSVI